MKSPILIAATSLDEHAYGPVTEILEARDIPVVHYCTDRVLAAEDDLVIGIDHDGQLDMRYNGHDISPDAIGAAWYRKVAAFSIDRAADDPARQMHVSNEIRALHETMWSLYPDEIWLNSPEKMRRCERKLGQLLLAHEVGFAIPETMVTSSWDEIRTGLLDDSRRIIVKMIRGVVSDKDVLKGLHTTPLDATSLDKLEGVANPFPGIYQDFIDKAREWRVTVVGDDIFPAAVYTDETAKDDWRKHQLTDAVVFVHGSLPDEVQERCFDFLARAGLNFGAFDFVENGEGEIFFLECNPNGQYGWLEDRLGFPISESIANVLAKIAARR